MNEDFEHTPPNSVSPRWSTSTKLAITLTFVAFIVFILLYFHQIVGPLLVAFIVVYLLYPVACFLRDKLRIGWNLAVNLIYLCVVFLLAGLLTPAGIVVVDQVQSLIRFLQRTLVELPDLLNRLSTQEITFGPFTYDLSNLDLVALGNQLLSIVQPVFGRVGTIVGALATGAISTLGWILFVVVISYFVLSESKGVREGLFHLDLPGYHGDIKRMQHELGRIWNAFLRGQLLLMGMTVVIYAAFLGIVGVQYFYVLALLAGLARFVPYIGPAVTWVVYFLVSYMQSSTIFGLQPLAYSAMVVAVGLLIDWSIDNLITPRLMSDTLRVHPAGVLVAALIGASWLGVVGIVLAAPVLASLKLLARYALLKLFDRDPWAGMPGEGEAYRRRSFAGLSSVWRQLRRWWQNRHQKAKRVLKSEKGDKNE